MLHGKKKISIVLSWENYRFLLKVKAKYIEKGGFDVSISRLVNELIRAYVESRETVEDAVNSLAEHLKYKNEEDR